ncbi:hypothetical protein ACFSQ0_02550 [Mesonia sediminis]|uniref:DUF3857 domain-containing protein n=1 Tax=Mesonia sediminis TaxID=1703946 RepID=A0ABW5SE64_9FLAO
MKFAFFYILLFFTFNVFSQKFAVVDIDTYDLIESVTFKAYDGNKLVYKGITKNNKATVIPSDIEYDKIDFFKENYKNHSIDTDSLNGAIFLTKEHIELNDVVISSNNNGNINLGESNRIVKSGSRYLLPKKSFGVVFTNTQQKLEIFRTVFYVDKVKHKTAYRIHYYQVEESLPDKNKQTIKFNENIYSTETLYLEAKEKNRIEIEHKENIPFEVNTTIFVTIELLYYLDDNNNKFQPDNKHRSKLKFQLSDQNNYYSKTVNEITSKNSIDFVNINLMYKYDFANYLYETPHKSQLLSPAIMLNAIKTP